jgi:hypothetical protein
MSSLNICLDGKEKMANISVIAYGIQSGITVAESLTWNAHVDVNAQNPELLITRGIFSLSKLPSSAVMLHGVISVATHRCFCIFKCYCENRFFFFLLQYENRQQIQNCSFAAGSDNITVIVYVSYT